MIGALGMHDEASGRGADNIKWITRDQGQGGTRRSVQHPELIRIDDGGARHAIAKRPVLCRQIDMITGPDASKGTKESVAMAW